MKYTRLPRRTAEKSRTTQMMTYKNTNLLGFVFVFFLNFFVVCFVFLEWNQ